MHATCAEQDEVHAVGLAFGEHRPQRFRTAVSAETDQAFSLWHNKASESWEKARKHVATMTGKSQAEADSLLEDLARQGSKTPLGSDLDTGIKNLNARAMQDAGRDLIRDLLRKGNKKLGAAERKALDLGEAVRGMGDGPA